MTANQLVPASVPDQIELAKTLAQSGLLPEQYRKNPANLLWAIQYAQALGVHPMTAVTGIAVINGKPTASAQLIGGLVRRAGHKLRVESTDTKAVATIIRADDPDYAFRVEWTMDRAKKAGLGGRGPWQQYPAAMLAARAITEVARMAAPEALFGIIYTPEELGADVDDDAIVTATAYPASSAPSEPAAPNPYDFDTGELPAALPVPTPVSDTYETDAEDFAERATRAQTTRIGILRRELGLEEDAYRRRLETLYGKTSAKDLTGEQAADLIDKLAAAAKKGGAQ